MINIQNIDGNKCFGWCLVRYLNPADHQPGGTTKADKNFPKTLLKMQIFQSKLETFNKLKTRIP